MRTESAAIGVIVLNFEAWPASSEVLAALQVQSLRPTQIVFVDNASEVDPSGEVRSIYPQVVMIRASNNGGYGAGMNTGLSALDLSTLDVVLLVTHDCVLAPKALEVLAQRLIADESVGVVGPLLCYRSAANTVFSAGGMLDRATWRVSHRGHLAPVARISTSSPLVSDWLDGSCLAIRAGLLKEVGLIDERFFLYYEDVEFCLRVGQAGYQVECLPSARAWQEPGGNLSEYLNTRNRLVLMVLAGARRRAIVRELIRGAYHTRPWSRSTGTRQPARTWWRAVRDTRLAAQRSRQRPALPERIG